MKKLVLSILTLLPLGSISFLANAKLQDIEANKIRSKQSVSSPDGTAKSRSAGNVSFN